MRRINGHLWRVTTMASLGAIVLLGGAGVDGAAASPRQAAPVAQAAQTVASGDPAADRLRLVTFGFLGLAALLFAMTVVYWVATRPDPIAGDDDGAEEPDGVAGADSDRAQEAVAGVGDDTGAESVDVAAAAVRSPEPALLPNPAALTAAPSVTVAPSGVFDADDVAAPAIDLTDGARGPVEVTPGTVEVTPGTVEVTPGTVEVAAGTVEVAAEPRDAETAGTVEGGTHDDSTSSAANSALSPLSAALAAIPDMEPTVVRFDDPPVRRVRRPLPPPGAPNFDRMARENTARHQAVESARRVEQRPRRVQRTIDPDKARAAESTALRRPDVEAPDGAASPAPASPAPASPAPASPAPAPSAPTLSAPALSSPALPRRLDPSETPPRRRFDPFPQRRVLRGEAAQPEAAQPAPTPEPTPPAPSQATEAAPTAVPGPPEATEATAATGAAAEAPRQPVRRYRGD